MTRIPLVRTVGAAATALCAALLSVPSTQAAPLGAAAPTKATAVADTCGATQFCLSKGLDGTGQLHKFESSATDTCITLSNGWSDGTVADAKWFANNLTVDTLAFPTGNCSGFPSGLAPTGSANLTGQFNSVRIMGSDCKSGKICFWTNTNFTGTLKAQDWANFCQNTGGIAAKTVWNRTGSTINLYEGSFCLGAYWMGEVGGGKFAYTESSWGRWNLA
jgi:hypothetical protein